MQHIIATANDSVALCGMNRNRIIQSGTDMCPDCAAFDKSIKEAIKQVRDPITGPSFRRLLVAVANSTTPENANQLLEERAARTLESRATAQRLENQALAKTQVTTGETKKMDYKSSAVRALKRGASAGVMKVVSKKIKLKLTEKFPQLALLPQNIWDVVLCLAINMTASASPDLPGIKMAESLSSEAFEGLLTDATSQMVQDVMEVVSETFLELAAEKKTSLLAERE
jgi:hypothetical protein